MHSHDVMNKMVQQLCLFSFEINLHKANKKQRIKQNKTRSAVRTSQIYLSHTTYNQQYTH